jgi:hypothetical protein
VTALAAGTTSIRLVGFPASSSGTVRITIPGSVGASGGGSGAAGWVAAGVAVPVAAIALRRPGQKLTDATVYTTTPDTAVYIGGAHQPAASLTIGPGEFMRLSVRSAAGDIIADAALRAPDCPSLLIGKLESPPGTWRLLANGDVTNCKLTISSAEIHEATITINPPRKP